MREREREQEGEIENERAREPNREREEAGRLSSLELCNDRCRAVSSEARFSITSFTDSIKGRSSK